MNYDKDECELYNEAIRIWSSLKDIILEWPIGLPDKNGKEIYQGDLIKDVSGKIEEVVLIEKDGYQYKLNGLWNIHASGMNEGEIVGNRNESPKLKDDK
jgi:hypothetical protein